MSTQPYTVTHNPGASRFEAMVGTQLALCEYRRSAAVVTFTHTEVPSALEGQGIAGAMVKAALAWSREQGLKVRPQCSYVALYMQRHSETLDLMAPQSQS